MTQAERYREAGVDLDAANAAKDRMRAALEAARSPLALGAVGAFGGMVRVPDDVPDPVLVMSTDGVGTKVLVAIRAGVHDTVGRDLVNHCVNDILVHGASPVAFLDYIAAWSIDPEVVAPLVEGVSAACREHGMTLAGGETAALPDLFQPGHYDLAGTIVGVVSRRRAIHGDAVRPGDLLIGYASNGLHTNGYTLARRIAFDDLGLDVDSPVEELGTTVGEAFLAVHRSYAPSVTPVLDRIRGMAHITGGGIPGNLARALPEGCGAVVEVARWPDVPVFVFLQRAGGVSRDEMFQVFNMGIGMIAVVAPESEGSVRDAAASAGVTAWTIGEVVEGRGVRIH